MDDLTSFETEEVSGLRPRALRSAVRRAARAQRETCSCVKSLASCDFSGELARVSGGYWSVTRAARRAAGLNTKLYRGCAQAWPACAPQRSHRAARRGHYLILLIGASEGRLQQGRSVCDVVAVPHARARACRGGAHRVPAAAGRASLCGAGPAPGHAARQADPAHGRSARPLSRCARRPRCRATRAACTHGPLARRCGSTSTVRTRSPVRPRHGVTTCTSGALSVRAPALAAPGTVLGPQPRRRPAASRIALPRG